MSAQPEGHRVFLDLEHDGPWTPQDVPLWVRAHTADGALIITPSPWDIEDVPALVGQKLEIIGGDLYVTPRPGNDHQELAGLLTALLVGYGNYRVLPEPNVRAGAGRGLLVSPDLVVVERGAPVRGRSWVEFAVIALAVEIASPSTQSTDRNEKARTYRAHGIGNYWLVDPVTGAIEVMWADGELPPQMLAECRHVCADYVGQKE